jgi:uracil-DNA glycosylase family 4
MTPAGAKPVRDLLNFYVESGVDIALDEAPANRFADPAMPPASAEPPAPQAATPRPELRAEQRPAVPVTHAAAPPPPEEAIMAARAAAKQAPSLEALREIMTAFEGCALRTTAKQLVFGDGSADARLMFVGEAPGFEEDQTGVPFVGKSGQLLDKMLAAIGIARSEVYIANVVPWRPPGNRDPSIHETQICLPFIQRQIELVDPQVLVCLGKPATATLLGVTEGIRRTRGRWLAYKTEARDIRAMPTFHPAYLLRNPIEKRFAWRDFLAIKKALAN